MGNVNADNVENAENVDNTESIDEAGLGDALVSRLTVIEDQPLESRAVAGGWALRLLGHSVPRDADDKGRVGAGTGTLRMRMLPRVSHGREPAQVDFLVVR